MAQTVEIVVGFRLTWRAKLMLGAAKIAAALRLPLDYGRIAKAIANSCAYTTER